MLKFLTKLSLVLCFSIAANADQQTLFDFNQEYQKATEQNDAEAQYHLGLMYTDGSYTKKRQFKGIEDGFEQQSKAQPDYIKAKEWFEKAANQGHMAAQHSLALLYYNGQGTKQNYLKGIEWDTKAAKKGDAVAQYTLATLYYNGTGVKQNYFKAKQWFAKAAEQNYSDAKDHLTVVTKKVNAIVAKQQAKKKQASNNDCGCD
ncbi:tetratricopeptide repeat protein [Gilliamella sp. ESL0250]|uniref:tetratricopeptide repeat protein n=1 Tax=Gilliamella sp. ESL0250 TaxID=2705036 RepID=UPI001580CBD7|nr:tetratricopeptide repeat protein [Gilliamella sp. ESL0250]NUF48352.1 sel1 repeat family protein [Gilliamella sp. ESL0250]